MPMPDRNDCYVVGTIKKIGRVEGSYYDAYQIVAEKDTQGFRVGEMVYVPIESDYDYTGRVSIYNGS